MFHREWSCNQSGHGRSFGRPGARSTGTYILCNFLRIYVYMYGISCPTFLRILLYLECLENPIARFTLKIFYYYLQSQKKASLFQASLLSGFSACCIRITGVDREQRASSPLRRGSSCIYGFTQGAQRKSAAELCLLGTTRLLLPSQYQRRPRHTPPNKKGNEPNLRPSSGHRQECPTSAGTHVS
jgi:hypothetical protein